MISKNNSLPKWRVWLAHHTWTWTLASSSLSTAWLLTPSVDRNTILCYAIYSNSFVEMTKSQQIHGLSPTTIGIALIADRLFGLAPKFNTHGLPMTIRARGGTWGIQVSTAASSGREVAAMPNCQLPCSRREGARATRQRLPDESTPRFNINGRRRHAWNLPR